MSKISAHILDVGSGPAKDFCIATQTGFEKRVNIDADMEIIGLVPGLRVVGRVVTDYDANAHARSGENAQMAANAFVQSQLEKYNLNPQIKIWEGPNEPVFGPADNPTNVAAFQWYAQFETERVLLMATLGLQCVTGNFPAGLPDIPLWDHWTPVWEVHRRYGGWTGVHEGQDPPAPTLALRLLERVKRLVKIIPQWGSDNDWTWLFLRVTRAYATAQRLGYPDARFLITECGAYSGWKNLPGFSAEQYAAWLARYDGELRNLSYVDGAFIFTSGVPWGGWEIDFDPVLPTLATLVPVGNFIAPPAPIPAPDPIPIPEFPYRVQVKPYTWNLRDGPGGPSIGYTLGGRQFTVESQSGDWLEAKVYIHKTGVIRLG